MRKTASTAASPRSLLPRTGVDLYVDDSAASMWVRVVVAEKDIEGARFKPVSADKPHPELDTLNPERLLPTLADREIVLFPARTVVEYLDERYPHPPLMPVEPVARAKLRLLMDRTQHTLFPLADALGTGSERQRSKTVKELGESLAAMAPVFPGRGFALGESFNLADCALAAVLVAAQRAGMELPNAGRLQDYARRLLARRSVAEAAGLAEAPAR